MSSSSSDEDGDEKWRAAVNSIAVDFDTTFTNKKGNDDSKRDEKGKSNTLKLYQSRDYCSLKNIWLRHRRSMPYVPRKSLKDLEAQDLLHNYLDKTLTIISSSELQPHVIDSPMIDADDDIRLFRRAPLGITLKPDVERLPVSIPTKKPRIPPRQEINEKSTEFKFQLQSVAVDGTMILAEAEKIRRKALARLEAKECAAQIAARKEEERVALLKQQRGEKWLPSIAKEMTGDVQAKNNNLQKQCPNLEKKHFDNNKLNRNKDHVNGKHQES